MLTAVSRKRDINRRTIVPVVIILIARNGDLEEK
jgi:hypothetical protein